MQNEYPLNKLQADVRTYAIRRVNPFIGVLQIIELPGGRAVSANGVVWDIEVSAERPAAWGSLGGLHQAPCFYRYGLWSLEDGLVGRPLAPHLEKDPLTRQCQQIIARIRQCLHKLPFKLMDTQELWLFDEKDEKPLVLLAALTAQGQRPSPEPKYWACSFGAEGVPSQYRFPESRELTEQIKTRAGFNIKKHWISRAADGSGNTANNRHICADEFPPYLIFEEWTDDVLTHRVNAYIQWIAPSLLTLQHLNDEQRQRLESSLHIQAISLEHHRQLYPQVINEKLMIAALVQCRLQKANQ